MSYGYGDVVDGDAGVNVGAGVGVTEDAAAVADDPTECKRMD